MPKPSNNVPEGTVICECPTVDQIYAAINWSNKSFCANDHRIYQQFHTEVQCGKCFERKWVPNGPQTYP